MTSSRRARRIRRGKRRDERPGPVDKVSARDSRKEPRWKEILVMLFTLGPMVGWIVSSSIEVMPDAVLAAGWSGTAGTMTVSWCEEPETSRHRRYCGGVFVHAADGRAVETSADNAFDPGDTYPAQLSPDGDRAVLRGVWYALAALPTPAFGLAMVGLMMLFGVFIGDGDWGTPMWWSLLVLAGMTFAVGAVGLIVGLVAGEVT